MRAPWLPPRPCRSGRLQPSKRGSLAESVPRRHSAPRRHSRHLTYRSSVTRRCVGTTNRVVDGDRILPRRRFFYERADSPDDLARTITLLYDTGERFAHLAEIRWLRAHPAQGGLRVCDCRG